MSLSRYSLERILEQVTYRPGWSLTLYDTEAQGTWLRIKAKVADAFSGGRDLTTLCVRSPLPPFHDEDAFLTWLRWRLERVEVHECHEWLQRHGEPIWNPHDPKAVEEA